MIKMEDNMRLVIAYLIIFLGFSTASALAARVEAHIDLSQQKMRVYENGKLKYTWPVSTARRAASDSAVLER